MLSAVGYTGSPAAIASCASTGSALATVLSLGMNSASTPFAMTPRAACCTSPEDATVTSS